tara:strand:- start:1588 stop:1857 length:270 start_codon:yes stop_codon:yes gene_type:complete
MQEYKSLNLETGKETIKKVTSEELKEKEALLEKLKKEEKDAFDALSYDEKRQTEYPTIQELVVALYDEEDKASIIERRNAVKAKYPKPE